MALKAILLNCTLKKSPEVSHTEALMNIVVGHLHDQGVETELIRPVDFNIPFGVESDLGDGDEWPQILRRSSPPTSSSWGCRSGSESETVSARWSSSASTAPTT